MNPRHMGCLLITGALVALAVKLWMDFAPADEPEMEPVSSSPAPASPLPVSSDPGEDEVEDQDGDLAGVEAPEPSASPSWWVVYVSDPGCALREADRDSARKVKVDLEAAEDLTHPDDADHLRGLSKADVTKLKAATTAAIVYGPTEGGRLGDVLAAQQVAGSMAAACHGYVYDPDLELVFSPDHWKREIVRSWDGEGEDALPRATNHFATVSQKTPEGQVLVTRGLHRFGIAELEIPAGPGKEEAAARLLDLAAQHEVERGSLPAELLLEIEGIDHNEAREQYERMASSDALLAAKVRLRRDAKAAEPTMQLELEGEQLRKADEALFGTPAARAKAVKALGAKARAKVTGEILPRYRKGLLPGEELFVMTSAGWLRVDRWTGARFSGAQAGDPLGRRDAWEVEPKQVLDYALLLDDGSWEGNTTGIELGAR